jgi:hypothetical protein
VGNRDDMARPPKYKTAKELQKKIDEYFKTGVKKRQIEIGRGEAKKVIEIPVPTITGLVLFCGFSCRSSFYDYQEKEEFTYTIKRARTMIEQEYEEQLSINGGAGPIFALKNFGWHDKQEVAVGKFDPDDEFL